MILLSVSNLSFHLRQIAYTFYRSTHAPWIGLLGLEGRSAGNWYWYVIFLRGEMTTTWAFLFDNICYMYTIMDKMLVLQKSWGLYPHAPIVHPPLLEVFHWQIMD
jgi:hypothetical protein